MSVKPGGDVMYYTIDLSRSVTIFLLPGTKGAHGRFQHFAHRPIFLITMDMYKNLKKEKRRRKEARRESIGPCHLTVPIRLNTAVWVSSSLPQY